MTMPLLLAMAQNAELIFTGLLPRGLIRIMKYGLYVAVPLCAYTVVSTFARGGFIALIVASCVCILLQRRRFALLLAVGVIAAIVVPFVPLPEGYTQRI